MKKYLVILIAATVISAFATETPAAESPPPQPEITETLPESPPSVRSVIVGKFLCYLPNLVMDLLDIFTLDLKAGLFAGAGARVTRAFGFGGLCGTNGGIYKEINRQYGIALEDGYQAQMGFLTVEDISIINPIGSVKEVWAHGSNFPTCNESIYNLYTGARDYWAIEAYLYFLAGAKVGLHPIEIADFITGIFFYDLKGDDIKLNLY